MGRVLGTVLVLAALMLASCSGASETNPPEQGEKEDVERGTEREAPEGPPTVKGPDYEVVEVVPLEESDPDFYEGPIEEAGIAAAEVEVQVEEEIAIQAAFGDATTTLTDYDIMNLDFYKGEELLGEEIFLRTPEARQAYQEEATGNLQELTEATPPPEPVATSPSSAEPMGTPHASVEPTGIQPTPEFERWNCRGETYVIEQGMTAEESEAFGTEMGNRLADDIEAGGDKDMSDILDEMGVPAYEEACGTP